MKDRLIPVLLTLVVGLAFVVYAQHKRISEMRESARNIATSMDGMAALIDGDEAECLSSYAEWLRWELVPGHRTKDRP